MQFRALACGLLHCYGQQLPNIVFRRNAMSIYRFSMREESQALTQALVAFFVVMLIMIGIAGTVYRVIAPDGWLADAFNRGFVSGLLSLTAIGLLFGLLWLKRGNTLFAKRSRVAEIIVMGFAGAGALYLLQAMLGNIL